jgi:ABC-2 type transport system permease protein
VALVFGALGTAIGSMLQDMQGFQLVMNFLVLPLFFLSGALFPLTNLPKFMAFITRLDPLTYGVDGLRAAFLGVSHFSAVTDTIVLAAVALVLLMLGSYSFSKIQI